MSETKYTAEQAKGTASMLLVAGDFSHETRTKLLDEASQIIRAYAADLRSRESASSKDGLLCCVINGVSVALSGTRTSVELASDAIEELELIKANRAAAAAGVTDVESMLEACVPGGSIVDPQVVCDNIREWFAYTAPPAQADVARDAARYRWLREHRFSFAHDEHHRGIAILRWGEWVDVDDAAELDLCIDTVMQRDAAMAAQRGEAGRG